MSDSSLQFRQNLARLVFSLRRVRPKVPFWQIPAHRVPTLTLYRNLLKEAPTPHIRSHVRHLFRKNRHLTSATGTQKLLLQGYKWLGAFKQANEGDSTTQAKLSRFSRLIAVNQQKKYWYRLLGKELEWQKKLRNRPILTGGFLRPSFSNGPLPRLSPQPEKISHMIRYRRNARFKRSQRQEESKEMIQDLRLESEFEEGLAKLANVGFERVFSQGHYIEWLGPIRYWRRAMARVFERDQERANRPYPPEMVEAILQARREKIENKTRERERERRGEVLNITRRRMRQGPPAHVLAKMTPAQRHMDQVSRSVGEVGYVAQVKRRLGFKFRDPDAWKRELSLDKKSELDRITDNIRNEISRRSESSG